MPAQIEMTTSCAPSGTATITYRTSGGYTTYDGAAAPAEGTVVVQLNDYVAHVLAVDTAPLGERLTYTVISAGYCRPTELAHTGAASADVAGAGLALVFVGALCALGRGRLRR